MEQIKYDALRAHLTIDLNRIDDELINLPNLLQDAAELAVLAAEDEQAAKFTYDVLISQVSDELRQTPVEGKQRSEARIATEVLLDERVQNARIDQSKARLAAGLARSLFDSLREKSKLLVKACDMAIAGFISPRSYSPTNRMVAEKFRSAEAARPGRMTGGERVEDSTQETQTRDQ